MSQLSFLNIGLWKKRLRCERFGMTFFLDEMSAVMPWKRLCALIEPH